MFLSNPDFSTVVIGILTILLISFYVHDIILNKAFK